MKILTFVLGGFATNCYLVIHESSKKACLIDTAVYDAEILSTITDGGITLEYIILTHGHLPAIHCLKAASDDAIFTVGTRKQCYYRLRRLNLLIRIIEFTRDMGISLLLMMKKQTILICCEFNFTVESFFKTGKR